MSGRLYDLRMDLELSADALGEKAGVSGDTIRNLERGGRPHTSTAKRLTTFFSREYGRVVPASELFGAPTTRLRVVENETPEDAA